MPKKKGKKKGDVLARMSVDQRRHYLERKAAQEQERARRREELLAGFLKLKLEDEKRKAGLNEAKLNVKWREILRVVKTKSLFSQLNNIKATTEESLCSLDDIIKLLHDSVVDAREQRARSSQGHMSFVKTMAELHEEHVSLLTRKFREKEVTLLHGTAEDIQLTARSHIHQTCRLQLIKEAAALESEQLETQEETQFHNAVASIKTKLEEEIAEAAAEKEEQLEEAWWQLATATQQFETQTSDIRSKCDIVQQKVTTNRQTLKKINEEIRGLKAELNTWKSQLADETEDDDESRTKISQRQQVLRKLLIRQNFNTRQSIKIANKRSSQAYDVRIV